MKKALIVAKWEYLEKIKSKAFIISLILTPAFILAFSILPALFAGDESDETRIIGIMDLTGSYFEDLKTELEEFELENQQPLYVVLDLYNKNSSEEELIIQADGKVLDGRLESYLLIKENEDDEMKFEFRSKSVGKFRDISRIEKKLNLIKNERELIDHGIDPGVLKVIEEEINVEPVKIEEIGTEKRQGFEVVFLSSIVFVLLLMMMIIYSGQMLVRSLLEEKSNRLMEILVSSCTPEELLAGKVIGLSALGLTQLTIWVLIGLSLTASAFIPMEIFNNIIPIILYFALGFVFYTTLFVGIGSVISSEQEAQQITTYLSILLVVPVVLLFPAIQNPDALFVKILSYIPLTLPSIMILRMNIGPVPAWEIILTFIILISSILISIRLSSKIFRIGILSYGKMPSFKELREWLKE